MKIRTIAKTYPCLVTYIIENEDRFLETTTKQHCMRIMHLLRDNNHRFFRLNANSRREIKRLFVLIELLAKFINVEDVFSDYTQIPVIPGATIDQLAAQE